MKIDDLKIALTVSRKDRDPRKTMILSTIVGNLQSNAKMVDGEKVVSDEDVVLYLKRCVKNLEETLSFKETEEARWELNYVNEFLPKQLTEEELHELWNKLKCINMGDFMKQLKMNYLGQYDGKVASKVANENLKG